jgi:hypothetical protein
MMLVRLQVGEDDELPLRAERRAAKRAAKRAAARAAAHEDGERKKRKKRRHLSRRARRATLALDKAAAFNARTRRQPSMPSGSTASAG